MRKNRERMHENSLSAYEAILEGLPEARRRVLGMIIEKGECTIEECAIALHKWPNQVSGRFTELSRAGIIVQVGNRRVDKRCHAVWKLSE